MSKMTLKRLVAVLGCVGMLAFFVGLFGSIQLGAYEEAVRSGTVSFEFLGTMVSRRYYRYTVIYGLIAAVLAGMDVFSLTTRVQTQNSQEPQPKDHPLGFLAVRARRYFLVLAGLAWVTCYVIVRKKPIEPGTFQNRGMLLLFGVLFGLSRRPLNKTIFYVLHKVSAEAEDALDTFLEGQEVHRNRDRLEQRR